MFRSVLFATALLVLAPALASAQQSSSSPGVRNVNVLEQGRGVWQLNFGVPKLPQISEPLGTSHWQWKPSGHVPGEGAWFGKPELQQIVPAPIDCAMARPADPAVDAKCCTSTGRSQTVGPDYPRRALSAT